MAARTSRKHGSPTAAHILRTCRFMPCEIWISSQLVGMLAR
jgi:hypothetical protein